MSPKKIKVLIVDDSILFRRMLIANLGEDPHLEVIGYAVDSFDAFDKIKELKPDVVTMDVEMPKLNGIEFIKKLMPEHPLPVVVVSSLPINALDALEAGAVDFAKKPVVKAPGDVQEFFRELITKVKIASIAHIGRRKPFQTQAAPAKEPVPALSQPVKERTTHTVITAGRSKPPLSSKVLKTTQLQIKSGVSVVAIGASTGGTEAILEVVRELPSDFPGVVVVQHMPAGFTKMYAQRLDKACQMSVKECEDGDRVVPGQILIAAGDYHMRLAKDSRGFYVTSQQGPKVSGHCPSVDALFDTVADLAGSNSIGVLLTGMGADGAKGLLKIRKEGGYTIGQDKESCVVYGMPMVAYNLGAVTKQLPIERINGELIRFVRSKAENNTENSQG